MTLDRLIGLSVSDDATYQKYRDHMAPFLEQYGGRFIVDVRVSEVLLAPTEAPINRMFVIQFPDEAASKAFFADPGYVAVREKFFVPSVAHAAFLGHYHPAT